MRGEIRFIGIKPNRALEKVVEREMDRWAQKETAAPVKDSWYEVKLTKESETLSSTPFYYCSVDAEVGACRWIAAEAGRTPLDALSKALKRVRVREPRKRKTVFPCVA